MSWRVIFLVAALAAVTGPGDWIARADEPTPALNTLIAVWAAQYELPETLLHRVIKRESKYQAGIHRGGHWGLMQIKYATAKAMGYLGPASGLLDPEINLRFGGRYLAGALLVAGGDIDRAMRLYRSGFYYEAKRKGLLEETGLKPKKNVDLIQ